MKKTLLMLLCCASSIYAQSQNLIRNGSFEELQFPYAPNAGFPFIAEESFPYNNLQNWYGTHVSGGIVYAPLLHGFNYAFPCVNDFGKYIHSGNVSHRVRMGQIKTDSVHVNGKARYYINNEIPEQLQQKLGAPLVAGCTYQFSAYLRPFTDHSMSWLSPTDTIVTCDSVGSTAIPDIGVYFTNTKPVAQVYTDSIIAANADTIFFSWKSIYGITPQIKTPDSLVIADSNSWYHFTGTYTAQGGELYITIGNFDRLDTLIKKGVIIKPGYLTYGTAGFIPEYISYVFDDISLVPVVPPPAPSLALGADIYHCDNNPFTDTLTATAGFNTYLWNTGDTTSSITVTQPGVYWCRGSYDCGRLEDSVIVYSPQIFTNLLPGDTTVCASMMPYGFQPYIPLPNYAWSTGDTTSYTFFPAPGIYTLTTINVCGSFTDTFQLDSVNAMNDVEVHEVEFCPTIQDSVLLQSEIAGISYLWSDGDTNFSKTVNVEGTYWIITSLECGVRTDSFIVKCPTSISGIARVPDINVYPNPANNLVTLDYLSAGIFEITDMFGRQLIKQTLRQAVKKQQISTATLAPGTYIWRYRTEAGKTITGKLLILRP